jgi:hypothetical protein
MNAVQEHEYALLGGLNRSKLGRYLNLIAAAISAAIVFALLSAVDFAKRLGIPTNLPPVVLSLASAASVFAALYWLFDKYAWKWPKLGMLLKVPDLSGDWHCDGQTINADKSLGYVWEAKITIIQTWDKIRVRLSTKQSGSNSVAAALLCDEADGYHLLYHYKNDPNIAERDLTSHRGFAELIFSKDRKSGHGEYFNGHGRYTFGTMKLRKL